MSDSVEGDVIDPELAKAIGDDRAVSGLRGLTDRASGLIAGATGGLSVADIDKQLSADSGELLSSDERIAIAEVNAMMGKYNLTPVDSVEGLIKLRKMLVRIYKDNTLVPMQVQVDALKLEIEIGKLERTREAFLDRIVDTEKIAGTHTKAELVQAESGLDDARVRAFQGEVANDHEVGYAKNDRALQKRTVDNDLLKKQIKAHRTTVSIIWTGVLAPVLRKVIWIAVVTLVVGMIFSYFVEQSHTPMYPFVAPFNGFRHFLLDPFWLTIQNWMGIHPPATKKK